MVWEKACYFNSHKMFWRVHFMNSCKNANNYIPAIQQRLIGKESLKQNPFILK